MSHRAPRQPSDRTPVSASPSPAAYLRGILDGILVPVGETYRVDETLLDDHTFRLVIRPATGRGSAIILGQGGVTIASIRRLITVHAASCGWTVSISLESISKGEVD